MDGKEDTRTPEVRKRQTEAVYSMNQGSPQQKKISRMVDAGLSQDEANGLAAWAGSNYRFLNKSIYAPNAVSGIYKDFGEGASILASQAIKKLPPYTHKQIEELAQTKGKTKRAHKLLPPGQLERGLMGVRDLDSFLKPYMDAIGQDEFREPTFFATTAKQSESFTRNAQVLFQITAKSDGTGQGRAIDHFKNVRFEGEVAYPPGSRFRIKDVIREGGKARIIMEEI